MRLESGSWARARRLHFRSSHSGLQFADRTLEGFKATKAG